MTIRAVLIGINEYLYNPDENRLRGCVNDAHNLAVRWKSAQQGLILLSDKHATKQNILTAWREQRDKCQPGDTLRIGHSSHGIEEGICCYNIGVKDGEFDPATFITYSEIAEFCREIPETVLTEFLIDACHTSRGIKSLGMTYGKAKFMQLSGGTFATPGKPAQPVSVRPNVVLWAACEPNQTSADAYIDNQPQGAFTAAFLKFEQKGRSRSDIVFYARPWLKKQGYEQTCHLYCSHDLAMGVME